ncbi:MAG: DUF721 domain-containing protein [Rhodocyclaceae bacterium]|nr:DUF721 domain-containing protein [Rhodocyclaceae bacterium]
MAARSLDAYLNSAGDLARLSAHAGRLVKLQRVFEQIAPSYLAASSRVANFKSGKVVIHADSGAVAAKLRQMLPSLVDEFSLKGAEVTEIQVKVQPTHAAPQHKTRAVSPAVGAQARTDLQRLSEALPEESPLKEPLQRLVKRSR